MPIEHTALHPASGDRRWAKGEYFDSKDLSGTARADADRSQHQLQLGQGCSGDGPAAQQLLGALERDVYAAGGRATTSWASRVNYCYACENAEGFRLYLDGKLLVASEPERTGERGAVIENAVHFDDTKPHAIRLEYFHGTGSAGHRSYLAGSGRCVAR